MAKTKAYNTYVAPQRRFCITDRAGLQL